MNKFMKFMRFIKTKLYKEPTVMTVDPIFAREGEKITIHNWPAPPEPFLPSRNTTSHGSVLGDSTGRDLTSDTPAGMIFTAIGLPAGTHTDGDCATDNSFVRQETTPEEEEYRQAIRHQLYEVSRSGNIRVISTKLAVSASLGGKKEARCYRVKLKDISGVGYHHAQVHRIVALAWVPNAYTFTNTVVNFIDGNTMNPHANNLEWATRARFSHTRQN